MTDVADASFARVSAAELLAAGYDGIMRYCLGAGKAITKDEYDALIAGGVAVGLVHEGGAQQAMRGFAGGYSDALVANAAADAIGHPRDRPIIYVLEDPSPVATSAWPTIISYLQGVRSAKGRPVWGYGSGSLLTHCGDAGLIQCGWEVSSWPGAGSRYSRLRQMATPTRTTFGGRIDQNIKLAADWGGHPGVASQSTPAAPKPAPPATPTPTQEDHLQPVTFAFTNPTTGVEALYVTDGFHYRHMTTPAEATDVNNVLFNVYGKVPLSWANGAPVSDIRAFGLPADAATAAQAGVPFP